VYKGDDNRLMATTARIRNNFIIMYNIVSNNMGIKKFAEHYCKMFDI